MQRRHLLRISNVHRSFCLLGGLIPQLPRGNKFWSVKQMFFSHPASQLGGYQHFRGFWSALGMLASVKSRVASSLAHSTAFLWHLKGSIRFGLIWIRLQTSSTDLMLPALLCFETGEANRLLLQKHHFKAKGLTAWSRNYRRTPVGEDLLYLTEERSQEFGIVKDTYTKQRFQGDVLLCFAVLR